MESSLADPDPVGSRLFFLKYLWLLNTPKKFIPSYLLRPGSGSGRLGPDPDPDPGLNK
jgi:hypothetical protein